LVILHKNKTLNREKWDHCIAKSHNSLVYAYTWYLDIAATNWEGIVLGDYEAVMPLPYNRKLLGWKQVYQPFFVQQLGVFSIVPVEKAIFEQFLKLAKLHYVRFQLNFNEGNTIYESAYFKSTLRNNYLLSLADAYPNIYQKFSHGLKQSIRMAQKKEVSLVDTIQPAEIIAFYRQYLQQKTPEINEKALARLQKIIETALLHRKGFLRAVLSPEKEQLAVGFFLKDAKRITYLVGVASEKGKKIGAMPFLLSSIMEQYAGQAIVFDFEGSMHKGIAQFFQSFGAKKVVYCSRDAIYRF
jgi:hypothetical protein